MELNDLLLFFKNYKRGSYTAMTKQTEKDGYKKITSCVIRFVNYYNIKEIKEAKKQPTKKEYERVILPHILKENTNTKNILLLCYTTKNSAQKSKNSFYYNDKPITEAEYYSATNTKKSHNIDCVFSVKIDNILSLGGGSNEKQQ